MEIKYSVMFGLKVPRDSNMPEELKGKIEKALSKKAESIQDYLDGIVESYMESQGLEDSYRIDRNTSKYREDSSTEESSKKSSKEYKSKGFMTKLGKSFDDLEKQLFSKLDKKEAEKVTKQDFSPKKEKPSDKFKEVISEDINQLVTDLIQAENDSEKSLIAYKVLNLKVKAYKEKVSEKMEKINSNDVTRAKEELGIISRSDNNSEADKKAEESYKELVNGYESSTAGIINQLNKLHVLSLTEYKVQDIDSRYNYIVKCCQDLVDINEKIDNVFKGDPRKVMLNHMYDYYDIDKFTKTILFNK